ncbi:hypothetical protein M513_03767 [Trichuris suis]|nr:hypothetical protein M513_03767 [Trichuris suis]
MKINSTESREVYNVAYKLIEAVNVTLMRHFVHNKVVVKPDLALFYNLTDLEYSSKEHLETGERIIVALHNDRLYYTHENKMRDLMRMLGERLYQSFCTYSNYMNYCAEKERDGTVLHTSIYPCKKCRPGLGGLHCHMGPHWSTYTAHKDGLNNCSVHSKCENTFGSYKCICHDGWRGIYCNEDIDECVSNPCQNQGECTNTDGSFSCKCPDDFTGQACEIKIDACKSLKCEHGFCTGKGDNALCQCYGQWKGSKCNEADDMCKREDTCINGGTCEIDALMNFTCRCLSGYNGEHCEIDENDCMSNPCLHGWCIDLLGGYKCICHSGMQGEDCSKSENKCARLDCLKGSCMLHNGVPYCNCDEDHYGIHCENEMDRCMSSPCSEAATCINDLKNKAYTCVCPEGYEGIDCKQGILCSRCAVALPLYEENLRSIGPGFKSRLCT